MKVKVKVKPNSKVLGIEANPNSDQDYDLVVKVKSPPIDGKANKEVIAALAKHYKVAKKDVELVSGPKSKIKVFKINL